MPFDRRLYPADWEQIRQTILARAGNACEWPACAAPNGQIVYRCVYNAEIWHAATDSGDVCDCGGMPVKIVLTTAHLCDCEPKCGNLEHLMSMCQRHHLLYDAKQHGQKAAATKRAKKLAKTGQMEMAL